jgi:hypothetical protein
MQLESSAIAAIMIPDALTPGQYYDGMRADDSLGRPIKRLMLAVLEDAMRCYQNYTSSRSRAQRRLFVEAEAWLMDRKADGAFAFETVCENLGIDPSCLREGLRRWRAQQLDGKNPFRLARRSPVTRVGRISAPLKRRKRKLDGGIAVAINGHGLAHHVNTVAHEIVAYDGEMENVNGAASGADVNVPAPIEIQEVALA